MKKWLLENGYLIGKSCIVAEENDSIETLEWFKKQGVSSFAGLAKSGSLDKMRWLKNIIVHLSAWSSMMQRVMVH